MRAREPSRVFLECWSPDAGVSLRVTFAELSEMMIAAALWLRDGVGIGAGESVALLAGNSVAYLSVSFGAMAIGAVSLNLNWRQPADVTEALLGSLKPALLVASAEHRAVASRCHRATGVRMALLETICCVEQGSLPFRPPPADEAEAVRSQVRSLSPSAVAAVFFTGGTTGVPKAVPHTHAGLHWLCKGLLAMCPGPFEAATEEAGALALMPYYHVMGFVASTLFCFVAGCRAYVLAGAAHTQARRQP